MSEMTCNQARHLFDVYLDGELSGSLGTELAAHRVACAACRRELALMEVAGHVIRVDSDGPTLSDGFSDRLLACMDEPPSGSLVRFRKVVLWTGGALAAAAVLALMFNLVAGPGERIAGFTEQISEDSNGATSGANADATKADRQTPAQADDVARRLQEGVSGSGQRVLELKDLTDKTIMQLLDELGLDSELSGDDDGGLSVPHDGEPEN